MSHVEADPLAQKLYRSASGRQWRNIGVKHHHGVNIPLFSLYSESSGGIGEFTDLIPLMEWCSRVGLDIIQLLPVNDTGHDTSPYNTLSAFALNPLHLGLAQLPHSGTTLELASCLRLLKEMLKGQRVVYDQVRSVRDHYLHLYYESRYREISQTADFQTFLQQNDWLLPFAVFKTLKELNHLKPWSKWPGKHRQPTPALLQEIAKTHSDRVNFHLFVQHLCFQQFAEVKKEAERRKIFLKGDLPILISPDSTDAWYHQNLFLPHLTAGAPPDMYSKEGQAWGFPVYDWKKLQETNYAWWSKRLRTASRLYHIYRLDHIVGFFRIWAIPPGKGGTDGSYLPENSDNWVPQGRKILLMMLESSPMLPIGEDLGIVPAEVRECMQNLGICGTKVMRWERTWEDKNWHYLEGSSFIPESMSTVSTHDSTTLRDWWQNSPEESKVLSKMKGWVKRPSLSTKQHLELLKDSHQSNSIFHINLLAEYLALDPSLHWPDPALERINTPGVISANNWSCRLRPSIEQILENTRLQELVSSLTLST